MAEPTGGQQDQEESLAVIQKTSNCAVDISSQRHRQTPCQSPKKLKQRDGSKAEIVN